MASTGARAYMGVREVRGLCPLKLRAFIHTQRLNFIDYFTLCFRITVYKKWFEFHIVKRSVDFCQLTSTDLRNTFVIVPA